MSDRKDWPWVTITLAVLISATFVWQIAAGADAVDPSPQWLTDHGGNFGPLTLGAHEPWRLFTSMFLHGGILHIAMNMIGLIDGGRHVEKMYGRWGFIALYLVAGLAGSLASALRTTNVVSVGASGAIFGVFGAFGAFLLLHRHRLDAQEVSKQARGLLIFLAYNIYFGLTAKGIDMLAHAGGLAAGFVCGLALEYGTDHGQSTPKRSLLVGVLGIALVFGATQLIKAPSNARSEFIETQNQVIPRVQTILQGLEAAPDGSKNQQIAAELDQQIAIWKAAREKYERDGDGPDFEGLRKFMQLRERGWQKIADGLRANDVEMIMSGVQDGKDADSVVEKVNQGN